MCRSVAAFENELLDSRKTRNARPGTGRAFVFLTRTKISPNPNQASRGMCLPRIGVAKPFRKQPPTLSRNNKLELKICREARPLARWPGQLASAEDVDVQMENRLPGAATGVDDGAVAPLGQAVFVCHSR
jgi:hypothetical protein